MNLGRAQLILVVFVHRFHTFVDVNHVSFGHDLLLVVPGFRVRVRIRVRVRVSVRVSVRVRVSVSVSIRVPPPRARTLPWRCQRVCGPHPPGVLGVWRAGHPSCPSSRIDEWHESYFQPRFVAAGVGLPQPRA